jgi:hypothetical protein
MRLQERLAGEELRVRQIINAIQNPFGAAAFAQFGVDPARTFGGRGTGAGTGAGAGAGQQNQTLLNFIPGLERLGFTGLPEGAGIGSRLPLNQLFGEQGFPTVGSLAQNPNALQFLDPLSQLLGSGPGKFVDRARDVSPSINGTTGTTGMNTGISGSQRTPVPSTQRGRG